MKTTSKRREIKPRETSFVAPRAVTISDRTSAALVGLEPRAFRELVTRRKIPHVRIGDRVVVLASEFEKFIERASSEPSEQSEPIDVDDSPSSVDAVLARLGRRRVAGAR